MELITLIASISGSVITIITLATTLIKPVRKKFIDMISKCSDKDEITKKLDNVTNLLENTVNENEKQRQEIQILLESQQASLRNEILMIYFNSIHKDEISSWERENVLHLYDAYKKLNGNSFVEKCVEEILEIPVKM